MDGCNFTYMPGSAFPKPWCFISARVLCPTKCLVFQQPHHCCASCSQSPSQLMSPLKVFTCICLLSQYIGDALLQWMHNFSSDLQQSLRSHKVLSSTKQRRYGLLSPFWIAVCRYCLILRKIRKEKKKIHIPGPVTSTAFGLIQHKWKSTTGVHDEDRSLGYMGPSALTRVRIKEPECR